ncbi:snare associated Golgi protein-domain-containing protein [Trametes elegans]|nr:snare associated Golgi protein-domain-containing protein [Trametes elegans]
MTAPTYDSYPPQRNDPNAPKDEDVRTDVRSLARTPSPTPSEAAALDPSQKKKKPGLIGKLFDAETFKNPKELIKLIITLAIIALVVLFIVYQQKIVNWLKPVTNWMKRTPGGWLIPIALLVVMSFPPLFGHEIVAVLCGDVWGPGIGFGIVAAGTLLGEVANYFVFKWFCMARGRKLEEKKLQYAFLAEVVRRGGFLMAVIIRYSAVPGHFTTAVFASCGMGFWTFFAAAFLSLPKQFATVYLGYAQTDGTVDKKTKTIKAVVIILTIAITLFAMRYVKNQTAQIKDEVIYRRRKARQAKLRAAAGLEPDPEAGFAHADPTTSPLLQHQYEPVSTVALDGVTLHIPQPQRGYAPPSGPPPPPSVSVSAPPSYVSTDAQQQHPSTWQPDAYAVGPPQTGYDARSRSRSRSPAPYGALESESETNGRRGGRRERRRERRMHDSPFGSR